MGVSFEIGVGEVGWVLDRKVGWIFVLSILNGKGVIDCYYVS